MDKDKDEDEDDEGDDEDDESIHYICRGHSEHCPLRQYFHVENFSA